MKKGFNIQIENGEVTLSSFLANKNDDLFFENDDLIIVVEGVVLNKKKLLLEHGYNDFKALLVNLFKTKKDRLFNLLEGEYRGCIIDKHQHKTWVFTNVTATQRVFYIQNENSIYIDTNLIRLSKTLKGKEIAVQPNLESVYQLLCFGCMLESNTPIQGVNKLLDGRYLSINNREHSITVDTFFDITSISECSLTNEKAIDEIHHVFSDAVSLEYQKDNEWNKGHLALLSGGLDSRVAAMYAHKLNLKLDRVLCFSQSNYFDEKISKQIAKDYKWNHEFIPLDEGRFLNKIDELTEISEGCVFYTGAIHVNYAIHEMQTDNFGLFHSGQIGDGVLGGFNLEPRAKAPSCQKIMINSEFLNDTKEAFARSAQNHEKEETFLLRNIAFNRTVLGAHVFQQKAYQTSPFMTKDFIDLAISLPEKWKYKHRFYIEWIKKHCEEATKYRWERTLLKPDAVWKTAFGDKVTRRAYNIMIGRILKFKNRLDMCPYQYYYEESVDIQMYYTKYFNENIFRIEAYPELRKSVVDLFEKKDFTKKSFAINVLSLFKLYF